MDTSSTSIDLIPDELIELILSKCDYKSMIRFKSVSKSWHSIISGPRLLRNLQSKLSENRNKFLIWDRKGKGNNNLRLHMIELVNGKSVKISELPYPHQDMRPLRSCNGLILLGKGNECMLWNPFIGKHIKIPSFAPATNLCDLIDWIHFNLPNSGSKPVQHIFYCDPITGDHRIVLVYLRVYVVYSCKNGRWSKIKYLPNFCTPGTGHICDDGIIHRLWNEVVYFDDRDGKAHRIKVPNEVKNASFELAIISSKFNVHVPDKEDGNLLHLWVMEEDGISFKRKRWRKLPTAEKAAPYVPELRPVCLSSEADNDVILWAKKGSGRGKWWFPKAENCEEKLFISNLGENWSFKEIDFTWGSITNYLPYTENLYMPF